MRFVWLLVLFPCALVARPIILASLFNPCWNLLRVTSRGAALRNELVTIGLSNRGLVLEVR